MSINRTAATMAVIAITTVGLAGPAIAGHKNPGSQDRVTLSGKAAKGWACVGTEVPDGSTYTNKVRMGIYKRMAIPRATHTLVLTNKGKPQAIKMGKRLNAGDHAYGVCKYDPKNLHQFTDGVEIVNRLELLYHGPTETNTLAHLRCGKSVRNPNVWTITTPDYEKFSYASKRDALRDVRDGGGWMTGCRFGR